MTEDKKKKSGLHKKISSIFEGVPLPQPGGPPQPGGSAAPPPEQAGGVPSKPLPPAFQTRQVPRGFEPRPQAAPGAAPKFEAPARAAGQGLWRQIKNKLFAPKPGVSSSRQKAMLLLVPVLFVVLIFILMQVLMPRPKVTKPKPPKLPAAITSADTKIEWEIPEPFPTTLLNYMEATQPPTPPSPNEAGTQQVEQVKPTKLIVKGILFSDDNPTAIVGTEIVHVGDKVAGASIVKINRDNVEFEMEGKKLTQNVEP
jgi:hypothetical protein